MSTPISEFSHNEDDVRILVAHPDPARRAVAAQRICRNVRANVLTDKDRRRAYKVLEYIAQDVAAMVRRALAITLKNSPELPHDLAIKLIRDIDNIAVPILENSPVLTDDDLLDVLKSKAAAKAMAIAKRPSVSGSIVRAIIRFGDSEAVAGIAANDRAQLSEQAYAEILELAVSDDLIKESLVARRDLPPRIIEALMSHASEAVAVKLMERHDIAPKLAVTLARSTHERAVSDFVDQNWLASELANLTQSLHEAGRLTPSLIIRAVACGQIRFSEHALARRAGISHSKAALMIHEPGDFGLKTLARTAKIGALDMHILRAAIAIFRDLEISGLDYDRPHFQRLMIERVLTLPIEFSDADGDYLLEKLDGLGGFDFN
ncbi:MAG: DUF2336 domain-containing protein [Robiginitomaculum sp.]